MTAVAGRAAGAPSPSRSSVALSSVALPPTEPRRLAELFDGVRGADGPCRPVRALTLSTAGYHAVGELTRCLAELVLAAAQRRAGTAGELLAALGTPASHYPLLDPAQPLDGRLLAAIRPDIISSGGVARFVELNIDGALGGVLQADLIAGRFLRYGRAAALPLSAPPSAVEARARTVRAHLALPDGASVLLPSFDGPNLPDVRTARDFSRWLAPVFQHGAAHGMRMFSHPLRDLDIGPDRRLRAGPRPVDAVFRTFVSCDEPASDGMRALRAALRAGTVRMFTPEATMLLTNKLTLAWLWEDRPILAERDAELVERHIPRTVRYDGADADQLRAAVDRRAELVLKPASGASGRGVSVGAATTGTQWRASLEEAARTGGYVLQQYVAADRVPMEFHHRPTGDQVTADVPYVLGPFLYRRRISGMLIRHGTPEPAAVLSTTRGATMNSVLLTGA